MCLSECEALGLLTSRQNSWRALQLPPGFGCAPCLLGSFPTSLAFTVFTSSTDNKRSILAKPLREALKVACKTCETSRCSSAFRNIGSVQERVQATECMQEAKWNFYPADCMQAQTKAVHIEWVVPYVKTVLPTTLPRGCWGNPCFFKTLTQEIHLQRLATQGSADILLITESDLNVRARSNLRVS